MKSTANLLMKRRIINVHFIAEILISLDWTSQTAKLECRFGNMERKLIDLC